MGMHLQHRGSRPAWVMQGAMYDLDFENNRYWTNTGGSMWLGPNSGATIFSNSTSAGFCDAVDAFNFSKFYYAVWKDGIVRTTAIPSSSAVSMALRTDYGLWAQGSAQGLTHNFNYCLQCRNLTNAAWVVSNSTDITATQTGATGADGIAASATKLTCNVSNGTVLQTISQPNKINSATIAVAGTGYVANEIITLTGGTSTTAGQIKVLTVSGGVPQTISINNAGSYSALPSNPVAQGSTTGVGTGLTVNLIFQSYTGSVWMKRVTGTGAISLTYDGATYTQVDGLINSSGYTQVSLSAVATLGTYTFGIKMATAGDAILVDFAQLENNLVPTMPILTTTTSVDRGVQSPAFVGDLTFTPNNAGGPVISNINWSHPGSVLQQFSCNQSPGFNLNLYADGVNGFKSFVNSTGTVGNTNSQGTTLNTTNTVNNGLFTVNKVCMVNTGETAGMYLCLNGGPIANANGQYSNFVSTASHSVLGNNGGGQLPLNGYFKRITMWPYAITKGQMQLYSTVTNNA